MYAKWGSKDDDADNNDVTVDTSDCDHYFWFSPGQTEHVVMGYFVSDGEDRQFTFGEPVIVRKKRRTENMSRNDATVLNAVGSIRIEFCALNGFKEAVVSAYKSQPEQTRINEKFEEKVMLAVKPGRRMVSDKYPEGFRYQAAILSRDIVYERRIVYNSFEGFNARNEFHKYVHQVSFYQGMPLAALMHQNIRKQAILAVCQKVRETRFRWETEQILDLTPMTKL